MRIGLIAQDCNSGIGSQSWEFYRHMHPAKTLITDINELHRLAGKTVSSYPERFTGHGETMRTKRGYPQQDEINWLLEGIDVLFVIETPLNHNIFHFARERGVKTVLQANYEFFDALAQDIPRPDLVAAPSTWHIEEIERAGFNVKHLPVPIATDRFASRIKRRAKHFIHVAGHITTLDRNGTDIVRAAWREVKNPDVELTVYSQRPLPGDTKPEVENYWELYQAGDVLLIPRKYGGLSLQIQEAMCAGIVPLMGTHDPYAEVGCPTVPTNPAATVPCRNPVTAYEMNPSDLAAVIDWLANKDIGEYSEKCLSWATEHSWYALKDKYLAAFEELLGHQTTK